MSEAKNVVKTEGDVEVDPDTRERRLATLLNNELVADDIRIAERILEAAKPVHFSKGDKMITQGEVEDCAYFIMSGSADIKINGRHIDFRNAPFVVGEMAVKRAGEARTADVVVVTQTLDALAVSGSEFRKLMRDFETFSVNLHNSIDALSRKKISQLGEKTQPDGWSWNMISSSVGAACALGTALATWLAGFSFVEMALMGASFGILAFVAMILLNPILRYRNMSSAAGYALIALIFYGSISYAFTINGENVELPLIDFSIKTEQKIGLLAVGAIALLILSYISGALDLRLSHLQDDHRRRD